MRIICLHRLLQLHHQVFHLSFKCVANLTYVQIHHVFLFVRYNLNPDSKARFERVLVIGPMLTDHENSIGLHPFLLQMVIQELHYGNRAIICGMLKIGSK